MTALSASLTIFFLVGAASFAIYAAFFGTRRALNDRVADLGMKMRVAYGNPGDLDMNSDSAVRALFRWIAQRVPEPKKDPQAAAKLDSLLARAGFTGSDAARNFEVARLSAAIMFGLLALAIGLERDMSGAKPIILLVVGAGVGAFVPNYFLQRRAGKRQQKIASQLSDVLDLLVVCVEAGPGLSEAIKVVGTELQRHGQEIGGELATVSGELTAGVSLGEALRNFAERTAVADIKPLAATLIQSEQLGAQIGPALRSISDSMRTTRRLRAEEAAQKTTVKILFPLVFFILPAMMAIIVGPAVIQIMHTLSGP
ncbi:MAG TPA: type II secretion system F family protein [Candidatus Binataceae bacterium]